ncbi:MAG: class I SAM-dependent methyltransferase [Proteobacteria bacterium]|nr:class I SAM-dependent methyltransferase [Pseudomonadota bacterium]
MSDKPSGANPYGNPVLYDLEYQDYQVDLDFYVQLARRARGPVLELGCGNGRVTLPIARAGVEIHGVDLSAEMLLDLRRKLHNESEAVRLRVRFCQADFAQVVSDRLYPLVLMPFNALHHLRDEGEVLDFFKHVVALLGRPGVFAFDCYLPDDELYSRVPGKYEERDFVDPRDGSTIHSWEESSWDAENRIHHVYYHYEYENQRLETTHLQLQMYLRGQILDLIDRAGLRLLVEGSDFHGAKASDDSTKWIVVCARA